LAQDSTNGPTGEVVHLLCEIKWDQKSEDWGNCVELVDELLERMVPCHYNLTQEGVDDALIELAYLEPRVGKLDGASN
jgi:hypothetical protein